MTECISNSLKPNRYFIGDKTEKSRSVSRFQSLGGPSAPNVSSKSSFWRCFSQHLELASLWGRISSSGILWWFQTCHLYKQHQWGEKGEAYFQPKSWASSGAEVHEWGGAFPPACREMVPQVGVGVCITREMDAKQTNVNKCPLPLRNLGGFFMSFCLCTLPAPPIATTVFIHAVFPLRAITVWGEAK